MSEETRESGWPVQYPFNGANEQIGYRVFPDEMENDPNVFFHGTSASNLASIVRNGFRPTQVLSSVSFARDSSLALNYACSARSADSPDGCVIMVKFEDVNTTGIRSESFGVHVDDLSRLPTIIGYCIIPKEYVFV